MAEPFSIASSVVPLVGAAIKCSGEVLDYIHDIKNAPEHVENTASSLKSCRLTLYLMQRMPQRASDATKGTGLDEDFFLEEPLREFERTCNRLSRKIPPYTWRYGRLHLSIGRRLSWKWNKSQIQELLRDLQRHQSVLSLLLMQQVHTTVKESQTTVEEMHTMVEDMRLGHDKVVRTLRRVKAGSTVSDDEEREVIAEFDRLEKTIREVRSYTALSEARSSQSSIANSSPRTSWAVATEQPSIDAVLDSGTELAHSNSAGLPTEYASDAADSSAERGKDDNSRNLQGNTYAARHARRKMSQQAKQAKRRETSAPVNVDDSQRITHRFVKDEAGKYSAQPLQPAPKLQEIRSAPTGILDATRDMDEGETRAYVDGYFDAMNKRIAHSYSAGSLADRPYDPPEKQREYDIEWRRFQPLYRAPEAPQQSPRRAFPVHKDDDPTPNARIEEPPAAASSNQFVNTKQIPAFVSTAPQASPLQQRPTNLHMRSHREYLVSDNAMDNEPKPRARQTRRRPPSFSENSSSSTPITLEGRREAVRSSTRAAIPIEEFVPPS